MGKAYPLAGFALLLALGGTARAEDAPPPEGAPDSATVYAPADFARFAPRTALDMLRQVPGFTVRGGDDSQRGLGQADTNVLIDGERVASKSDDVFTQLQRISAARVERIEIVDGGSLGIPGLSGQVANIITRPGELSGSFTYRAGFRPEYARPLFFGGEVSISSAGEQLDWTLAYTHDTGRGGAGGGVAYIADPAGAITDNRDALVRFVGDFPKLSGSAEYTTAAGTVIDVNASYYRDYSNFSNDETRRPVGEAERFRNFDNRERGWGYELGGTIDLALGTGRLKLIGLERFGREHVRQTSLLDYADGAPDTGNRYSATTDSGERIGRLEYNWPMLGGTFQMDAEAAFNRLDRAAKLFDLSPAGAFVEVAFPEGSGGVQEDRYEAILTHNRTLAAGLTLQLGAGGEYSQLAQTGPGGLVREFWRPKGSASLAWAVREGFDITLGLSREVGQLSFGDFLASVQLAQGNQNAGNALLVPQQSWELELEVTRSLGQWGSTTLRLQGQWIEDYLEIVPAPGGGEALGNIDSARIYSLDWNATINLDPIGFRGAKLDAELELEKSHIRDPLTGEGRSLGERQDRELDLTLRHDVPGSDWAWGVGLEYDHTLPYYRLSEVGRDYEGPLYTFGFIEHKDVLGLTAKLTAFNLTNGRARFERTVYDGYRDRSPVLFREYRDLGVSYIFNFELTGDF